MTIRTISDTSLERTIYERAAREQEEDLVDSLLYFVDKMETPSGWYSRGKVGRPKKHRPGGQEQYGWQGLVVALCLKTYYNLDFRRMAAHLAANPELCERLGFPGPPSHTTLNRAQNRIPVAWMKKLNRRVVEPPKKTLQDDQEESELAWIQLDLPT